MPLISNEAHLDNQYEAILRAAVPFRARMKDGCLCEGWGVSISILAGRSLRFANVDGGCDTLWVFIGIRSHMRSQTHRLSGTPPVSSHQVNPNPNHLYYKMTRWAVVCPILFTRLANVGKDSRFPSLGRQTTSAAQL